jgi:hypothetical protein
MQIDPKSEHHGSVAVTTSAAKPECLASIRGRHQPPHRQIAARAIVTRNPSARRPPLGSVQYRKQVPTVCTWDACEEVRAFEASTLLHSHSLTSLLTSSFAADWPLELINTHGDACSPYHDFPSGTRNILSVTHVTSLSHVEGVCLPWRQMLCCQQ